MPHSGRHDLASRPSARSVETESASTEERWESCFEDPNLSSSPESIGPGRRPYGEDLDLHIGWDRFERLVLEVARNVLGLRGVKFRRYGVQGQAQHGIDLAGRESDGSYTVVQCKDYQQFTAGDLRNASNLARAPTRKFPADHGWGL
jgi:hypothetical protein